jgi:hypothetical protein
MAFGEDRLLVQQGIAERFGLTPFGLEGLQQPGQRQPLGVRVVADDVLEIHAFDVRRRQEGVQAEGL